MIHIFFIFLKKRHLPSSTFSSCNEGTSQSYCILAGNIERHQHHSRTVYKLLVNGPKSD